MAFVLQPFVQYPKPALRAARFRLWPQNLRSSWRRVFRLAALSCSCENGVLRVVRGVPSCTAVWRYRLGVQDAALSRRKPGFESRYRYQTSESRINKGNRTKSACRKPRLGVHRTGKRWPSSSTVLAFSARACLHASMSGSPREEESLKPDGELRQGRREGIVAASSSIGPWDFLTDS